MISAWWLLAAAIVFAGLGVFAMALMAAGGQTDDCERCACRKWRDEG